jgi:hypothetical protein
MKNLTPHQEQLIDEMITEFSRINPKPSVDGKKRFSIASIDECNQEKNRFLQTMAAHNRAFLENAIPRMQEQFQEFAREFGEVVLICVGTIRGHYTFDSLNDSLLNNLNGSSKAYVEIKIVPKGKPKDYEEDGKIAKFCAGIKSSSVNTTLLSGEKVYSAKYESIWWGPNWHPSTDGSDGWGKTRESLEGFLQSNERLQQAIVRISNIK